MSSQTELHRAMQWYVLIHRFQVTFKPHHLITTTYLGSNLLIAFFFFENCHPPCSMSGVTPERVTVIIMLYENPPILAKYFTVFSYTDT